MKITRFLIIGITVGLAIGSLAAEIDQTNPKAAATSFAKALETGDAKTARQLSTGSEDDKQVVDAMVAFNSAVKKLRDAAVKKYTDKADEVVSPGSTIDSTKVLEDTDVKEEGDTATIISNKPQPHQSPMHLKKVDGKWKINLSPTLLEAAAPGQTIEQMHAMIQAWADIFNETSDEIGQGKYPTPADANQALSVKMMASLKSLTPTTGPTTSTTNPAN